MASSFEEEQCVFFELVWTDEADRRMYANWVVETLYIVDHGPRSLFMCFVGLSIHFFGFEAFEKAFHWCIVVAIAFAAHALFYLMFCQLIPISFRRKLTSTVAVNDQSTWWPTKRVRLVKCGNRQLNVNVLAGRPTDDLPRVDIFDRAEVVKA